MYLYFLLIVITNTGYGQNIRGYLTQHFWSTLPFVHILTQTKSMTHGHMDAKWFWASGCEHINTTNVTPNKGPQKKQYVRKNCITQAKNIQIKSRLAVSVGLYVWAFLCQRARPKVEYFRNSEQSKLKVQLSKFPRWWILTKTDFIVLLRSWW